MGLVSLLKVGGPVVWILTVLSVVALTVIFVKTAQYWQLRDRPIDVAQLNTDTMLKLRQAPVNTRAFVAYQALQLTEKNVLSLEQMKLEALRIARLSLAARNSYLRVLEVIASVAPLLGLLGTVLGMIHAFQAMEAAGSQVDPSVLSGGIWLALLTTAVGVAVAIPVSIAHSWFERRVELAAAAMQDDLEHIFTLYAQGKLGKRVVAQLTAAV